MYSYRIRRRFKPSLILAIEQNSPLQTMASVIEVSSMIQNRRAEFVILGRPTPMGRPRVNRSRNFYSPSNRKKHVIQSCLRDKMLLYDVEAPLFRKEERLQFNVVFCFTKKADLDNMVKFALDIGNDVLYSDDEQVDIIHCEKRRVSSLNECKTTIRIERR